MNINYQYKLKDGKSVNPTSILFFFYLGGKRFSFGTGMKIFPELWNAETQRPINVKEYSGKGAKNRFNYLISKYSSPKDPHLKTSIKNISNRLDNIIAYSNEYFTVQESKRTSYDFKELKNVLKSKFALKAPQIQNEDGNKLILELIKTFVANITNGTRHTKQGKRFSYSTIKTNRNLISIWSNFQDLDKSNYRIKDISKELFEDFLNFMNESKYSLNTTKKHLTNFKIIIRDALANIEDANYKRIQEGQIELLKDSELSRIERSLKRYFTVSEIETTEIALSKIELQKLLNLDLSQNKGWDIVRDIFCVGCMTGARISDYSRLGKEHYKKTINGSFLEFTQKKTGKKVTIPVRPALEKILKKYNYQLPKTSEKNINQLIKLIAEKAGIKDSISVSKSKGEKIVINSTPKFKMIKSHTARRTFATQMIIEGFNYKDIMILTGHKSIKSFEKYLRIDEKETAKRLANSEFFKGTKSKIINLK